MKETFVFYKSWMEALTDVPDDIRLEVYDCIIEYAFSGKVPSLKPMAKMAFNFIKNDIDRASEKYKKIVDRNKNNGAKGGRPKTHTNPKNPVGFSETQENPNEYDNEYDNEHDNEHDNKNFLDKGLENENDFDQSGIVDNFSSQEEIINQENSVLFPEEDSKNPRQTVPLENKPPKKVSQKKGSGKKYFSATDFKKMLIDLKVDEKDADDWINIRRQKRAVFTENAIKLVQDECARYNLEFPEAIKYSAKYGWQGFEYEWYLNKKNKENGKSTYQNPNNGFSNSAGNSGGGVKASGKVSARTLLARRITENSSGNSQSGNTTIDVKAV